jgi:hypothetical protein
MSDVPSILRFVEPRNPVHRIHPGTLARLCTAQSEVFCRAFASAADVLGAALSDAKLDIRAPHELQDEPPESVGEKPFPALYGFCGALLRSQGVGGQEVVHLHAANLAQRIHMLRAFHSPDRVLDSVAGKVAEVANGFPRVAADIEVGRNPGDVLDPFILSATQVLLCQGSLDAAVGATVAHKALMMIEGLLGHLHEDIVGEFRGNLRSPEPRGFNQELLDLFTNPFPGADIVQPPTREGMALRFHQVKSKTGSAKGGDGKRLGEQLLRLQQYYRGETFYAALVGNTLRGHRSMNGVLRASPKTVVLVGASAFRELTGCDIGPELLMRVYQNAFSQAARATGYSVQEMARAITQTFRRRAEESGEDYLDALLRCAVGGAPDEQDSRLYRLSPRSGAGP